MYLGHKRLGQFKNNIAATDVSTTGEHSDLNESVNTELADIQVLNDHIRDTNATNVAGPSTIISPFDEDTVVLEWKQKRDGAHT